MLGARASNHRRRISAILAVLICLSLFSGVSGAGAANVVGGSAVITGANGDAVRLRAEPGAGGAVVGEFAEGTAVFVVEGPITAPDGSAWYLVAIDGVSGYMAAEFLVINGARPPVPPAVPAAPTEPAPEPTPEPTPAPEAEGAPGDEFVAAREITGQGTIVNAGGGAVRCRAANSTTSGILALLYEGNTVELQGRAVGSWQPVRCNNRDGWVHTDFIAVSKPPADPTPTAQPASGPATVAGTNGAGANCRARASTGGTVITVLAEGATVTLRGAKRGDWQPVVCARRNGFVWAAFVKASPAGDDNGGGGSTTQQGVIFNTNGDGVRCRDRGSLSSNVITILVEGAPVALRGAVNGDWQPVTCAGRNGFVHKDFVKPASGGGDDGGGGDAGSDIPFKAGELARVTGTNGAGVRLRSARSTSASVVTVVAEGEVVDVRSGSGGDWVAVTYRGSSGFIHRAFLGPMPDDVPSEPAGDLVSGNRGKVTDRVNFRSGPSFTAGVLDVAPPGTVVLVTGNRTNGFYPVNWGGLDGFIHGDFLVRTDEPLSGSDPGGIGGGDAGNGSTNPTGNAMVNYAMQYLGYPYVWATAGPNSFDCSGFTYWVTKHVIGKDIGRGLWTQIVAGPAVSYGNLQPGDLVFFQNTYTWGLSHVGIYIGNNQFVHAENEDTGVRISSLTSTYYSTRYYGAVRLS